MKNRMYLQLFEGGDGAGGTGAGAGSGNQGGNAAYTYEQLEEVASARANKAERAAIASYLRNKGMSEEDIRTAIDDFKAKKKENQPNVSAIERERDEAIAERDQLKNTGILRDKGVKADDIDYVMFKVGKMVDDKTDFAKAADKFLKENPRYTGTGTYRVSTSTGSDNQDTGGNMNMTINDRIRAAARR